MCRKKWEEWRQGNKVKKKEVGIKKWEIIYKRRGKEEVKGQRRTDGKESYNRQENQTGREGRRIRGKEENIGAEKWSNWREGLEPDREREEGVESKEKRGNEEWNKTGREREERRETSVHKSGGKGEEKSKNAGRERVEGGNEEM